MADFLYHIGSVFRFELVFDMCDVV